MPSILLGMEQLPMFEQEQAIWSVREISRYLRDLIESTEPLQNIWVQGEISNFSRPKSGHWYFTLKDTTAQLPCVMWRTAAELQLTVPEDGESVQVHGGLSVYEAGGRYQLYVDEIRPAGEGKLYQDFLRLKAKLEAEGLFALERKRALPGLPRRIGIVTSPVGAALRDILNTITRRFPLAEVIVAPAAVQGPEAPAQLAAALRRLNQFAQPDLILLARGGGSLEDLAAFNSEKLARTIVASQAPVVCGIGHETDFTIADFAADLRAPTPTAAAELATPNKLDLAESLAELSQRLARSFFGLVREQRWALQATVQTLERHSPLARILRDRQRVDDILLRVERALRQRTRLLKANQDGLHARLLALDPARVLERGYAVVSKTDGSVVSRTRQVSEQEALTVRVSDGRFGVQVKKRMKDEG
ncbi:MAG TPA: exodeoxyribonuclease VII large subunit [Anaerolineales bacterium]|nr:exodeoxyribonuclease VII large subunit [Anaerolineales bacterium]